MGIHSRDYFREPQDSRPLYSRARSADWALKYLLIANVAVFLLQSSTVAGSESPVTYWLSLSLTDLYMGQIWRLITYGFCHDGLNHLLINMLVLWVFGRVIEPIYGSREFLSFYLVSVVVSGACHVLLQLALGSPFGVVGASGGVMAVVFLTAMVYPRMTVLLFMIIPMQLRWLAVIYLAMDLVGIFDGSSGVSHVAHLGGAIFGMSYRHFGWAFSSLFARSMPISDFELGPLRSSRRLRTTVRLYEPNPTELDEQVDQILAKISEEGESSLTDMERATLRTASRRASQRLRDP